MNIESFLEQLKTSINLFPELYTHCKLDVIAFKHGQRWTLARGVARAGTSELLSEPHSLPTPAEILHLSETYSTEQLLSILKGVTEQDPVIEMAESIIHLSPTEEVPRPYVFDLFEGKDLETEFGGYGTLYRLSGEPLYSLTSTLNYDIHRVLSTHYRSQATDLYQLIERATNVLCYSNNSVTLDIFLPTYSKIRRLWPEKDELHVEYDSPKVFVDGFVQVGLETSYKKPDDNMRVMRTKSGGDEGFTLGLEPKKGFLRVTERFPLDWPDGHFPRDGIIRTNLYHRGKKKLLCYYEEDLNPPEIDEALASLFSRIQQRVDGVLERLDSELRNNLRNLLIQVEPKIDGLEVRTIGGGCKSIVEEVLLVLQGDEEYQKIELNKTIDRVYLLHERMKQAKPDMSNTLLEHLDSYSNYFRSFNEVVNRGYHSQKEGLVDEDARALIAHLYLWLNDLFRLLEVVDWTPNNRRF
jgi:hypothetical protein